jgi:hypothetical protein
MKDLVHIDCFKDDFISIISQLSLEDNLKKKDIDYIQVIDDYTASNRDLSKGVQKSDSFKKLCTIIEEELLENEFASEVYESNLGYSFTIHSSFGIFWISYEGDVFRYFTTREDCLIFINKKF